VITDPPNADGFRLGGVDVRVAASEEQAHSELAGLVDSESAGIVGINENWFGTIDDRLQKKIESGYRPLVIALPVGATLDVSREEHVYLARLIRRAIGFDITLRRG
jgi:vacuolar-type H+-ATPase subunit F/Vma7